MARRFTRSLGRIGSTRGTVWFSLAETITALGAANTAALVLVLNAAALAFRPFTIIRTHLTLAVSSDQSSASEDYSLGLGMSVVSEQASAVGITAVPTPFTELDSDLFFVHNITAGNFRVISAIGFDAHGSITKEIDSKAMRKVEDGQDVILTLENSSVSAGTNTFVAGRMLIKTN